MEKIKDYILKHKKDIVIFTILIVLSISTFYYIYYFNEKFNDNSNNFALDNEVVEEKIEKIRVDIKGEVNSPGTYQIDSDKRVIDAILLAGGLTDKASTRVNNLSMKVFDEMVIIIYSKDEIANFIKVKEEEKIIIDACNENNDGIKNDSCIKSDDTSSNDENTNKLISVNDATLDELTSLPGIGEAKAKNIISYRNKNGRFESIEDIKKVDGIGDNLFAQIKDFITT